MTRSDPMWLEDRLQRMRLLVGQTGERTRVAERLATEGMGLDDLELLIAYCEDRAKEPQGLLYTVLRDPQKWVGYVRDIKASGDYAGARERGIRANIGAIGRDGSACSHGVGATRHCESCDPRRTAADRLAQMRDLVAIERKAEPAYAEIAPTCRDPGSKVRMPTGAQRSWASFADAAQQPRSDAPSAQHVPEDLDGGKSGTGQPAASGGVDVGRVYGEEKP